ncbi:MAG: T9SS type A sorting domain-containing protein [Saprospiraceae bacterium]|nr:T9SS type A sorting domain-containing protein [Saprospiraceae bacterium]MBK6564671.1 T9SS type A sorting domain-containing protein [Saprospiraceae bacterium]
MKNIVNNFKIVLFCIFGYHGMVAQQHCVLADKYWLRQSELDSFNIIYPVCTSIDRLRIYNNDVFRLDSLYRIKEVTGEVIIDNTNIPSLNGLHNLQKVGKALYLLGNDSLRTLEKLKTLNTTHELTISNNDLISDLDGLEIDSIKGRCSINNNDELKDLSGFKIKYCNNIDIHSNKKLTTLNGASVEYVLQLGIHNLPSIQGIENFNASKVAIGFSETLQSISEINSLKSMYSLNLNKLDNLSFCSEEIICKNLNNPNFYLTLNQNAHGCNTKEEIRAGCINSTVDVNSIQYLVYPNPTYHHLNIEIINDNTNRITNVDIIDMLGKKVISEYILHSKNELNLSDLPAGIYLGLLKDNERNLLKTFRIIKL